MYTDVLFCLHIDFVLVLFAENLVKVFDVVLIYIFDAIIVHDEREWDFSGLVAEKAFAVFDFDVVVFRKMGDEVVVRNASRITLSCTRLCWSLHRCSRRRRTWLGCSGQWWLAVWVVIRIKRIQRFWAKIWGKCSIYHRCGILLLA